MHGWYCDKILLHFCEFPSGGKIYTTLDSRDRCKVIASYLNCNHFIDSILVLFLSKKFLNHLYCIFLKNQHNLRMFLFLNKIWFKIEIEIWYNDFCKKNICISPKSVISSWLENAIQSDFDVCYTANQIASLIVTWLYKMQSSGGNLKKFFIWQCLAFNNT